MARRTKLLMRTMTLMLLALAACSSQPSATTSTPSPTPSTTVLGARYGAPTIVDITTVDACTLLSVGEIQQVTGTTAGAPVAGGTAEALPSCVWTVADIDDALKLTVATAADHETSALGVEEPDLGDEAQWIPAPGDDGGELRVLIAARDRSFTMEVAPGVVLDARAAARALALRIVPRV